MSTKTRKRLVAAKRKRASAQGSIYVGRNDPCPCGSGKKAKRCCLKKIQALEDMPPALREQVVAAKILGHFGERQPVTAAVAAKFAAVNAAAGTAAAATDSLAQAIVAASLTGETGSNDMRAGEGTSGHQGRAEPVVEPPGPCGSYDFSGSDGVQGR
jgi:hypothetical protein